MLEISNYFVLLTQPLFIGLARNFQKNLLVFGVFEAYKNASFELVLKVYQIKVKIYKTADRQNIQEATFEKLSTFFCYNLQCIPMAMTMQFSLWVAQKIIYRLRGHI